MPGRTVHRRGLRPVRIDLAGENVVDVVHELVDYG